MTRQKKLFKLFLAALLIASVPASLIAQEEGEEELKTFAEKLQEVPTMQQLVADDPVDWILIGVGNQIPRNECKVMVVQPVKVDTKTPRANSFLAVDAVQSGPGDLVLAAREGNTARQILGDPDAPLHAVIVGVVDEVSLS